MIWHPVIGGAAIRDFRMRRFRANLALADRLEELAREKGCTAAQVALEWLLRRHQDVVPIPGTSSITRLEENAHAVDVHLDRAGLQEYRKCVSL